MLCTYMQLVHADRHIHTQIQKFPTGVTSVTVQWLYCITTACHQVAIQMLNQNLSQWFKPS